MHLTVHIVYLPGGSSSLGRQLLVSQWFTVTWCVLQSCMMLVEQQLICNCKFIMNELNFLAELLGHHCQTKTERTSSLITTTKEWVACKKLRDKSYSSSYVWWQVGNTNPAFILIMLIAYTSIWIMTEHSMLIEICTNSKSWKTISQILKLEHLVVFYLIFIS